MLKINGHVKSEETYGTERYYIKKVTYAKAKVVYAKHLEDKEYVKDKQLKVKRHVKVKQEHVKVVDEVVKVVVEKLIGNVVENLVLENMKIYK